MPKSKKALTETELVELVQKSFFYLDDVDKSLITQNVIDAMNIDNSDHYHIVLKGVNPEYISKKRALEMLVYDREVYGLLTKELQEDPDILEATTFNINKLPSSLFDNKVGVNYVLDKWNKKGKSWAYAQLKLPSSFFEPHIEHSDEQMDTKCLLIKPNIEKPEYVFYMYGVNRTNEIFIKNQKFKDTEEEVKSLTSHILFAMLKPVKYID